MKAHCTGNCNGSRKTECKYYKTCFSIGYIIFPKLDSLIYLQLRLKGIAVRK